MKSQDTKKKSSSGEHVTLVIVESPSKAKTINRYLGKNFLVKASVGHVKELPRKKIGIDFENDYAPYYTTISGKEKILKDLVSAARKCNNVVLATDPDREGEAIAWHISNELEYLNKPISRALFNEITPKTVRDSLNNTKKLDYRLVQSQQARQGIDKIVGYKISPFLWKTVLNGLSAGRVQSVALRLICERESEINAFVSTEYWSVKGNFLHNNKNKISTQLAKINDKNFHIKNETEALKVVEEIKRGNYSITDIRKREKKRKAPSPFTTSLLQQAASNKFSYGSKRTMSLAQQLYEGIKTEQGDIIGLITYMRTDSKRVSKEAQNEAEDFITENFGNRFSSGNKVYKMSSNAQNAHEAIRPTSIFRTPDSLKKSLNSSQFKLYELIWQRFLASQMSDAKLEQVSVDIQDDAKKFLFRATGRKILFEGFLKAFKDQQQLDYEEKKNTKEQEDLNDDFISALPENLVINDKLSIIEIDPNQHFTKPPARYSEASLVKELDNYDIGRPSTYATILSTIVERGYIDNLNRRLKPTELGKDVNKVLVANFSELFNVAYTSKMELDLDKIASGDTDYISTMDEFYKPFEATLIVREENPILPQNQFETTCPDCGQGKLITKWTKRGKFIGCSRYPSCKHIEAIETSGPKPTETVVVCPVCQEASMLIRVGKFGSFLSCSNYPDCKGVLTITKSKTISPPKIPPLETSISCTKCKSPLYLRDGKRGLWLGCSKFPKCRSRMPWKELTEEEQKIYRYRLREHEQKIRIPVIKSTNGDPLDLSLKIEELVVASKKEEKEAVEEA